jgi:hypothetical protein
LMPLFIWDMRNVFIWMNIRNGTWCKTRRLSKVHDGESECARTKV